MTELLFFPVFAFLTIFALFWIIRLAVRYGTHDALQMNRHWLDTSGRAAPTDRPS